MYFFCEQSVIKTDKYGNICIVQHCANNVPCVSMLCTRDGSIYQNDTQSSADLCALKIDRSKKKKYNQNWNDKCEKFKKE